MTISTLIISSVLMSHGVDDKDIDTMMCIAYHESKYKAGAINHSNRNGTKDYGLFQINSIWKKPCGFTAQELLDVNNNIKCAAYVYEKQGLKAWVTLKKCS